MTYLPVLVMPDSIVSMYSNSGLKGEIGKVNYKIQRQIQLFDFMKRKLMIVYNGIINKKKKQIIRTLTKLWTLDNPTRIS